MHLLAAFSDHGFGHVAQCAPVVNALAERVRIETGESLRVTVYSRAPEAFLGSRLRVPFTRLPRDTGVGLVMDDALTVNRSASLAAYQEFHREWAARVEAEANALMHLAPHGAPDLVLCDVPYLPLAAAKALDVPAVGLCSFNWHDMFRHYCGDFEVDAALIDRIGLEIRHAYESASLFIQPEPFVPAPEWLLGQSVGPIGQVGTPRRKDIERVHPSVEGRKLVLVSLGGIDSPLPLQHWPRVPGVTWIVPTDELARHHQDAVPQSTFWGALDNGDSRFTFQDLFASCDAVITKPGYGTYVEAAALGMPLIYLPRGDWPEEPVLAAWLHRATRAQELKADDFLGAAGRTVVGGALESLWSQEPPPRVALTGAVEAANLLWKRLG